MNWSKTSLLLLALALTACAAANPSAVFEGIPAPDLLRPIDDSTGVVAPTFEWQAVSGAAYYWVELSTSPTFVEVEVTYATCDTRTIPVDGIPCGTHYWRVSGVEAGGHLGTPSAFWSFTKGSNASRSYWPTKEWRHSSPEMQGMDSTRLVRLFEVVDSSMIRSILIVRHGHLVLEAYAPGVRPDTIQPIYSCTKSFTSALVGIALDKGYLSSVDQCILDFYPHRPYANPDPRKRAVTLENLLTMTPGLNWWEQVAFAAGNTLMEMEQSPDWVQFFLDRPMVEDPGIQWNYNTGCAHMLSAIVQQKSGQTLAGFAAENLFTPIGITSVAWPADRRGISFGGRGIYMTARDMARFGYLYAREGMWEGRQVIPTEWVRESTKRRHIAVFRQGYAYLWWVPEFGGVAANGYLGQRIFVIPGQDLVVVVTASISSQFMMTWPEYLMSDFILPAVASWGSLADNPIAERQLNDRVRAFGRLP